MPRCHLYFPDLIGVPAVLVTALGFFLTICILIKNSPMRRPTLNPNHPADSLGRLEDLPADYIADMTALSIAPLWPQLRGLLPRGKPSRATQPFVWHYSDVRPQLMRAGQLTPI